MKGSGNYPKSPPLDPNKIDVSTFVMESDWVLSEATSPESELGDLQADLEVWLEEINELIAEYGEEATVGQFNWQGIYRDRRIATNKRLGIKG